MSLYNDIMALTVEQRAELLATVEPIPVYQLERQYNDMLDECCEPTTIAGHTYDTSTALQAVDPVAWRCGFADFVGNDEEFIEINGETYAARELEDAYNLLDL